MLVRIEVQEMVDLDDMIGRYVIPVQVTSVPS